MYFSSRIIVKYLSWSNLFYGSFCICLSWFYAISSQVFIPLPWNVVPISIQPLPVTLCTMLFGWPAVIAYGLYLLQGSLGAPFFAGMKYGITHLVGPTGGYLLGFLFSAVFLASVRSIQASSRWVTLMKLEIANIITFSCGIAYLSLFVPAHKLLLAGLVPFLFGDFILKAFIQVALVELFSNINKKNNINTM